MKLPSRSVETIFRSIADLRELCLQLRDAWLEKYEVELFKEFELLKQRRLTHFDSVTLQALRYAFRKTWATNDFGTIVQAGTNLPAEILCQEPLLAAYLAAAKEQLEAQQVA